MNSAATVATPEMDTPMTCEELRARIEVLETRTRILARERDAAIDARLDAERETANLLGVVSALEAEIEALRSPPEEWPAEDVTEERELVRDAVAQAREELGGVTLLSLAVDGDLDTTTTTLADFLRDNAETLTQEDRQAIEALAVGESFEGGGGASLPWVVTRTV